MKHPKCHLYKLVERYKINPKIISTKGEWESLGNRQDICGNSLSSNWQTTTVVIGPQKLRHCQIWLKWLLVEWKLTAKSINLKENPGKIKSVFFIRAVLLAEKLGCCLKYCKSWKNTLRKLAVAVNTGRHLIRVLNERSVTDGGNLCPLWLVILKSD